MRRPQESLDDFTVKPRDKAAGPPAHAPLGPTGEVKVLKPLVRREQILLADPDPATANPFHRGEWYRLSWFQSSLAAAGVMLLIFLSALFIANLGIEERGVDSADAAGEANDIMSDSALEPLDLQGLIAANLAPIDIELLPVAANPKRMSARRAVYRPREPRAPRPAIPAFIPTTLIIYPENGEIKTRIEPQLVSVNINR